MKKSNRLFLKSFLLGVLIPLSFAAFAQLHVDADEDVGIGTTSTNNAKLRIYNTQNIYSMYLQNINTSNSGTKYGIRNDTRLPSGNTSTAGVRGFYNEVYPYGAGGSYGIMSYVFPYGTGEKIGVYSYAAQTDNSTRKTYAFKSDVYPRGTGQGYGMYNGVYQYGTGTKMGVYNYVRQSANGTGSIFGTRNNLYPYGTGTSFGSYSSISSAGAGTRYGMVSSVNKAINVSSFTTTTGISVGAYDQGSSGSVYGLNINSSSKGSGTVRGIYNVVSTNGTGQRYGIENRVRAVAGSTGVVRGIYNKAYLYGNAGSQGIYNQSYTNDGSTGQMIGFYNTLHQYGTGGTGNRYALYSAVTGTTTGAYAGYFVGNVYVTGTITSAGSDERLKENVADMKGGLAIINQLQPKTYTFKKALGLNLPDGKQFGLMAQDLEKVLPSLVSEVNHPGTPSIKQVKRKERILNPNPKLVDVQTREIKNGEEEKNIDRPQDELTEAAAEEDFIEVEVVEEVLEYGKTTKYKTVRYEALIPVLISAMKEQQKQIELLQKEVAQLKKERKK